MEAKAKFKIVYSEEADNFLNQLPPKVKDKIIYNIAKSKFVIAPELFKKLDNTDIWEFRTLYNKNQYRLLAFWDKVDGVDTLVIATHGFIKKTQKTPSKEITKAEEIRKIYFNSKNKNMEKMKFYTEEEIIDKHIGKKGTLARDKFEEDLQSFLIGEAIKKARQSKNLTQEELGNLIGVQRAQISRIESGKNLTLSTLAKVFKAMGISAKLEIDNLGKVALW